MSLGAPKVSLGALKASPWRRSGAQVPALSATQASWSHFLGVLGRFWEPKGSLGELLGHPWGALGDFGTSKSAFEDEKVKK